MNIYVSHSSSYDYENELYKPIRKFELAATHHFFLPHELENMDIDAKDQLEQTDYINCRGVLPIDGLRY